MARKSNQRGTVEFHRESWTVRYRKRDWSTRKWALKRHILEDCADKESALLAASEFMQTVNEQNSNPVAKTDVAPIVSTFRDFVNVHWHEYCLARKHTAATVASYGSLLKVHLLPFFGDMELASITPPDITRFFNNYVRKHPGKSAGMLYRVMKVLFHVAVDNDLIAKSPVRSTLHLPETAGREEKITLRPATIRQIILTLSDELKLFMLVLSITGVRVNECRAFRWFNFDESVGELSVTHSLFRNQLKSPKTKASQQTIPLPDVAVKLLVSHKVESAFPKPEDFIFSDSAGGPLSSDGLYKSLYTVMDGIGLQRQKRMYGFHAFRHSAGTILYEVTRDTKLVQRALRHARLQTTVDYYVHPTDVIAREATDILIREIMPDCDPIVTQEKRRVS